MRQRLIGFLFGIILVLAASVAESAALRFSEPVWPILSGEPGGFQKSAIGDLDKNVFVGFRAVIDAPDRDYPVWVRLTASSLYRIFVNGEFAGHGPARGPHGYYRVDEWDIADRLKPGKNTVAIEVAGYNACSFYLLDQPSFLQAEIISHRKVLATTALSEKDGKKQFSPFVLRERVQKVQRYSFQRPFIEVYRLKPDYDRWRYDPSVLPDKDVSLEAVNRDSTPKGKEQLLPRRVPYPRFEKQPPVRLVSRGSIKTGLKPEKFWKDRSLSNTGPQLSGYPESELEIVPSQELQTIATANVKELGKPFQNDETIRLKKNSFAILDLGTNLSGFIGAKVTCSKKTRLYLTFDEILTGGDVDFKRLGCVNAVLYEMEKGTYTLESFEPYTLRYLKLIVLDGDCEVQNPYLRDYVNPDTTEAKFSCSDRRLNQLFEAGRQTFVQNAVDIFMDCPSRERAGWLCDSFFTARVAFDLCHDTSVEKNFIENYLLPEKFKFLPDGMLPMCYPADHYDGVFIPNWALFFVVQLEEYLTRSQDRELVDALQPKVQKLFEYFKPFLNNDGLLEKLDGWVFVEWSKANSFVQDVNYPSNMLYAAALSAAGRMYGKKELLDRAQTIRETIHKQSFDGEFFIDNAVRKDGKLELTNNHSEVCQYFAFFFDIATPESHPKLWETLRDKFGPQRKETQAFPDIHPANSFIGNVLRLEILSRYGHCQQILDESIAYLLYMADRTGTLWENDGAYASCNHGFASHIIHTLYRDVLGVYHIDPVEKTIRLRFTDLKLDWCEGRIPLPEGDTEMRWWKEKGTIRYRIDHPAGYSLHVESMTDKNPIRMY